jgi:hypothetical protein
MAEPEHKGSKYMGDKRTRPRTFAAMMVLGLGILCGRLAGCGPPPIARPEGVRLTGYDEAIKKIQANPLGFLRESLAEAEKLEQFTTDFSRQERLGVLKQLHPLERIRAEYRREPLSIRFTWLNKDSEFQQCVYVAGQAEDKVRLLPRMGMLGLPPTVQKYPPNWAVLFGKSKFPMTDFGPKRLMEKTIDRIERAEAYGKVRIALKEPTEMGPHKEPCFYLEIHYPEGDPYVTKLQDLYVNTQTLLPVATFLWLPGKEERSSETLDAMYQYAGMRPDVKLQDLHFRIDLKSARRGKSSKQEGEGRGDAAQDAKAPAAVAGGSEEAG